MNKEQLQVIKKASLIGTIIGLIIAAISFSSFIWSKHELLKLDQGKLDETVLQ